MRGTRSCESAKPGGTGSPAPSSSPSAALLPPNDAPCSRRSSARAQVWAPRLTRGSSPCRPCRRRGSAGPCTICDVARPVPTTAGSPYSRQTIAACDMTPPISVTAALIFGKIGAQAGEVMLHTRISPSRTSPIVARRAHDAGDSLHDAGRGRGAAQLGAALRLPCPGVDALRRDAPEHDQRRVEHRLGHGADGGRRRPVREPGEQLAPVRDDRRPVLRPARFAARRPGQQELVEGGMHLQTRELEDAVTVVPGIRGRRAGRRTRGSCSTSS